MTKSELIKALEPFSDDDCVIIGDKETGWSNTGEIKQEGSCICLMEDMTRPFSSDNLSIITTPISFASAASVRLI